MTDKKTNTTTTTTTSSATEAKKQPSLVLGIVVQVPQNLLLVGEVRQQAWTVDLDWDRDMKETKESRLKGHATELQLRLNSIPKIGAILTDEKGEQVGKRADFPPMLWGSGEITVTLCKPPISDTRNIIFSQRVVYSAVPDPKKPPLHKYDEKTAQVKMSTDEMMTEPFKIHSDESPAVLFAVSRSNDVALTIQAHRCTDLKGDPLAYFFNRVHVITGLTVHFRKDVLTASIEQMPCRVENWVTVPMNWDVTLKETLKKITAPELFDAAAIAASRLFVTGRSITLKDIADCVHLNVAQIGRAIGLDRKCSNDEKACTHTRARSLLKCCGANGLEALEHSLYDVFQLCISKGNRTEPFCEYCRELGAKNHCKRCATGKHRTYYCDSTCQTKDWQSHKEQCTAIAEAASK